MSLIILNCLILGDNSQKIFPVNIQKTKSVGALKDLIKEKNPSSLGNIDAKDIELRIVNLPPDNIESELVNLKFDSFPALSLPVKKLSSIFKIVPDDDWLHIVAKAPEIIHPITAPDPIQILTLNCLILGDDSQKIFPVNIQKTKSVGALKDLIKEKNPSSLGNIDAKDIELRNVTESILLHDLQTGERVVKLGGDYLKLLSGDKVSSIFEDVSDDCLHIIAITPEKPAIEQEEGRDQISSLNKRFENAVSRVLKAIPPSESAKSSAYTKSQLAYSIHDGRYKENKPRTSVAPPIQLFHSVFGHFLDNINDIDPIPDDIIHKTAAYMKGASAIYPDEQKRGSVLTPILCEIFGVDIQTIVNNDKTSADGVVELLLDPGRLIILLQEDKNEFGEGGSDPATQAGLSTARSWAQTKFQKLRNATNCPTFLIATAGPWITILGAIFTDGLIVQRLTDYTWVGLDSVLNERHILRVARKFYALKKGLASLKSYYNTVQIPMVLPAETRYFPSITAYPNGNGRVHFKYIGYLEDGPDCVTLRAQTLTGHGSPRDVVVKFVDRYGERAHHLLAEHGLAPELLYCGSPHLEDKDPSYDSLSMIVMGFVDGDTLANSKINGKAAEKVRLEIKRALELLHDNGLVFGDLRTPNVMITAAKEVKLIDFNWAGVRGQAKYPILISSGIPWPADAKPLAVIEINHDWEMLNHMFSKPVPFIVD